MSAGPDAAATRAAIGRLLRPSSVAIVGASDRVGPGLNAYLALEKVGFAGRVHLVNPSKRELFGRPTAPSLAAVGEPVDLVFVAVPQAAVADAVRAAAERGAGGAVVLSSGFGEAGPDGARAQRELVEIATARGMAMCGPNCLGFLNFAGRAAAWGTTVPDAVPPGGVAAVVQSGSIGIALLNSGRELGLAYLITSGNEAVTTATDYIDYLVDDPDVSVVIGFFEQLRKPETFLAAARRAAALGKPVIVVKTGRSERGRAAVMAHTGAVAGSDEVCEAAFRAAGVMRVASLDELIETAILTSTLGRPLDRPGVAIVSPSGGEIALALDLAEPLGLALPDPAASRAAIAALLPDFAHVGNPLDLTWAGIYDPSIAQRCAALMGGEAEVGAVVLLHDAPRGLAAQQADRYTSLLRAVAAGAREAGVPLVVVSNFAVDFHPSYEAAAREAGTPCLRGTAEGLGAVARFARWSARRESVARRASAAAPGDSAAAEARRRWQALDRGRPPAEHEARAVLAPYGLEGPAERLVADLDGALAAARAIGYPVVLKGLAAGVQHKTEAGLVRVGIDSDDRLRAEWAALDARLRAAGGAPLGVLVQAMARPVAELLVGARVDPEFGPVIVVGGGGVTVELYRDVAVRLAPVTEEEAREMIAETRAGALLRGFRGRPPGDVAAAARAVARLSAFVADFRAEVAEAEINPLAVLERGALALDCLITPAARA